MKDLFAVKRVPLIKKMQKIAFGLRKFYVQTLTLMIPRGF